MLIQDQHQIPDGPVQGCAEFFSHVGEKFSFVVVRLIRLVGEILGLGDGFTEQLVDLEIQEGLYGEGTKRYSNFVGRGGKMVRLAVGADLDDLFSGHRQWCMKDGTHVAANGLRLLLPSGDVLKVEDDDGSPPKHAIEHKPHAQGHTLETRRGGGHNRQASEIFLDHDEGVIAVEHLLQHID